MAGTDISETGTAFARGFYVGFIAGFSLVVIYLTWESRVAAYDHGVLRAHTRNFKEMEDSSK
jgi:hypothetical protein